MLKSIRKKTEGFTIIEVMIVLAIAGLILLIVFLAVPALQRSAKNQQRKTDATAMATAISDYESNNNGQLPNQITMSTLNGATIATISCTTKGPVTGCDDTNPNVETAKIGYYGTTGNVPTAAPAWSIATNSVTTQLRYEPGDDCNSTGSNLTTASPGAFALIYGLDNGSGVTTPTKNCVD
ncbi:MAG TPA: type II secretion system protein [Candidatus Saccharimonadales bacterium]|nr:type II secretion system protein [Candidatus Saccharimonadales bacterium]